MYTVESMITNLGDGSMHLGGVNKRFVLNANGTKVGLMDMQVMRNDDESINTALVGPFPIVQHEVSGVLDIYTLEYGVKAKVIPYFTGTICTTPDGHEFRTILDAMNHVMLN